MARSRLARSSVKGDNHDKRSMRPEMLRVSGETLCVAVDRCPAIIMVTGETLQARLYQSPPEQPATARLLHTNDMQALTIHFVIRELTLRVRTGMMNCRLALGRGL